VGPEPVGVLPGPPSRLEEEPFQAPSTGWNFPMPEGVREVVPESFAVGWTPVGGALVLRW
jgi:hypothetical protein